MIDVDHAAVAAAPTCGGDHAAGGGTVLLPAGDYLCTSVHVKSNVALYLDQGCTLVAADPKEGFKYDAPEPNPSDPTDGIPSHYAVVSIDWGDKTPLDTSSGTISYSGAPGSNTDAFTVSGTHLYADEDNTLRNLKVKGERWLDVLGVKEERHAVGAR